MTQLPNISALLGDPPADSRSPLDPSKIYRASTWGLWEGGDPEDDPFKVGTTVWAEDRVRGHFFGLHPSTAPEHPSVACAVVHREPGYVWIQKADPQARDNP